LSAIGAIIVAIIAGVVYQISFIGPSTTELVPFESTTAGLSTTKLVPKKFPNVGDQHHRPRSQVEGTDLTVDHKPTNSKSEDEGFKDPVKK